MVILHSSANCKPLFKDLRKKYHTVAKLTILARKFKRNKKFTWKISWNFLQNFVKIVKIIKKSCKNQENCKQNLTKKSRTIVNKNQRLVHFARISQTFYEPILQFDTMSNFQNPFQNPILKVHTTFGHAWLHLTSAKT